MRWIKALSYSLVAVALGFACGGETRKNDNDAEPSPDDPCGAVGTYLCSSNTLYLCVEAGGQWTPLVQCTTRQTCDPQGYCMGSGETSASNSVTVSSVSSGAGGSGVTSGFTTGQAAGGDGSITTTVSTTGAGGGAGALGAGGDGGFESPCDIDSAMASCQGTICHGSPGTSGATTLGGGLDLFAVGRESSLVDQPATYLGVADIYDCPVDDPELIIDSENPSESLILKKIRGTQSCGAAEPIAGMLSAADEGCIADWVAAVAAAAGG